MDITVNQHKPTKCQRHWTCVTNREKSWVNRQWTILYTLGCRTHDIPINPRPWNTTTLLQTLGRRTSALLWFLVDDPFLCDFRQGLKKYGLRTFWSAYNTYFRSYTCYTYHRGRHAETPQPRLLSKRRHFAVDEIINLEAGAGDVQWCVLVTVGSYRVVPQFVS